MYDELTYDDCRYSRDPLTACALEGVASIVAGIADVSLVIHSPQGCAATVAAAYDRHEIDFTRRKVGCTRLFETDIVMGASAKLKDMIREADRVFNTGAMFVVGTCAADIIGEDIDGVCREMQPQVGARLIPIVAGGFRGNSYEGMDLGFKALLPLIKKGGGKIATSVNIIAPQANSNPTWWADLKWVIKTLNFLGIGIQAVLPHETSLQELEKAGQATANILLSHDAGYAFALQMQELFGIPLILSDLPLPVGLKNTARWLRALGSYFGVERSVEQVIGEGEEAVIGTLRRRALMIIPRYRNCRIAVSADATMGIGLIRMLFEELEMIPALLLLRSGAFQSREILGRELDSLGISPPVVFSADGYQIGRALQDAGVDAVLGSAWERYIAESTGIKIAFDVLIPTNKDIYVDRSYFGYEGMLNIMETIANDWEMAFRSKKIAVQKQACQ